MATAPPLTHHEILALVEPFSRQGRQVDLAGSDRTARKLLFKPVERVLTAPDLPALRETLELESLGTGSFKLTRVLTGAGASFCAGGDLGWMQQNMKKSRAERNHSIVTPSRSHPARA